MALDHALMDRARQSGETVLRVYSWSQPVLSLGRNQRAKGLYVESELEQRGIAVVRRPTGGRALLHHREITYSVTAPATVGSLTETYQRINALLLNSLRSLGVPAELAAPRTRTPLPDGLPCFAEPSAGELVVERRKLVGSAQWRDTGALLQHGSIIVDDDQQLIASLMHEPAAAAPPATLRELLGRAPTPEEFAERLFASVRSSEDAQASTLSENDLASLDLEVILAHYANPAWTWRR
jgi:lipoate-protein ligase A